MGNESPFLQLTAAVQAGNARGIKEELGKIIPRPHEIPDLQTLQALLDIIDHASLQVAGHFLRTFTKYLKELGYAHESTYYFALKCADVYRDSPQQLIAAFHILVEADSKIRQYEDMFVVRK